MIGYFKNDRVIQSQEFQGLAGELQRALTAETKPHIEIVSVRMSSLLGSDFHFSASTSLLKMNTSP